ncbi:hypothetical protein [Eubacterium sp.]|uniref:hypothetical protein n=1 Tax=Eubacterium sp. TaxID=142586 RepID=UPI0026DFE695|nr:hypothetical protein [Eubacterium sp.]MDO5431771.1 hypothetical protein [Eubacterium sp.]
MREETEEEFLNFLMNERMALHFARYKGEHPNTPQERMKIEKVDAAYNEILALLDEEHRDILNQCVNAMTDNMAQENEAFYLGGFRDGLRLDQLVRQYKEQKI